MDQVYGHHVPHFRQARLPIINGSDPLPLTADTRRIGSFGIHWLSAAESELNLAGLLEEIKTATLKIMARSYRYIDLFEIRLR